MLYEDWGELAHQAYQLATQQLSESQIEVLKDSLFPNKQEIQQFDWITIFYNAVPVVKECHSKKEAFLSLEAKISAFTQKYARVREWVYKNCPEAHALAVRYSGETSRIRQEYRIMYKYLRAVEVFVTDLSQREIGVS